MYKAEAKKNGQDLDTPLDGFTGDQRFFLSWAQVWRTKYRQDALRQRILTDPHSPARYRINGIVRNVDLWYKAFKVSNENILFLKSQDRVSIW
jgi:predicted metalloendopeptidase